MYYMGYLNIYMEVSEVMGGTPSHHPAIRLGFSRRKTIQRAGNFPHLWTMGIWIPCHRSTAPLDLLPLRIPTGHQAVPQQREPARDVSSFKICMSGVVNIQTYIYIYIYSSWIEYGLRKKALKWNILENPIFLIYSLYFKMIIALTI